MKKLMAPRITGALFLLFMLSACSNTQENSLLSDRAQDPSAHSVDKTPKVEELYLKTFTGGVVATGLSKVEVSGECYTSTFPSHNIIAVRNNSMIDMVDLNPETNATSREAFCRNGRFNVAINVASLNAGQITFILQARDSNNQVVTNNSKGLVTFNITK